MTVVGDSSDSFKALLINNLIWLMVILHAWFTRWSAMSWHSKDKFYDILEWFFGENQTFPFTTLMCLFMDTNRSELLRPDL